MIAVAIVGLIVLAVLVSDYTLFKTRKIVKTKPPVKRKYNKVKQIKVKR